MNRHHDANHSYSIEEEQTTMNHAMLWAAQTWRNLAQRLTNWARKVLDAMRARASARGAFTPASEVAREGEEAPQHAGGPRPTSPARLADSSALSNCGRRAKVAADDDVADAHWPTR